MCANNYDGIPENRYARYLCVSLFIRTRWDAYDFYAYAINCILGTRINAYVFGANRYEESAMLIAYANKRVSLLRRTMFYANANRYGYRYRALDEAPVLI